MKRHYYLFSIIILCLILVGCKDTKDENINDGAIHEKPDTKKEEVVDGMDIFDFYFINRAPKASKKHPLDELIKIYFSSKGVAIDVENQEIIEAPRFATNGVATFEEPLPFNDKEGLLEILEKHNVQDWKDDYTTEDPDSYQDGYGWMMLLQFEDGTIERYKGNGTDKVTVFPENFDEFAEEMEVFKMDKIEEGKE